MSPDDLQRYLDVLRAGKVRAAAIRLPDGTEVRVDFEPELAEGLPLDAEPPAGGWKHTSWKGPA